MNLENRQKQLSYSQNKNPKKGLYHSILNLCQRHRIYDKIHLKNFLVNL